MPSFDEIAEFVSKQLRVDQSVLTETTTLEDDLGVFGDDMDALLREYSTHFQVDMSDYRWYFHTGEDGYNFGALFFRPPNHRVKHIPITIQMLCEFAQAERWNIQYPEHTLPRYRIDIFITCFVTLALFVFLIVGAEIRGGK